MNKQGSTLIVALVLMIFITTLGLLVLRTAHLLQAVSFERSEQRPPQMLLESLIVYACQAQGGAWLKLNKKPGGAWLKLNKKPAGTHTTDLATSKNSIIDSQESMPRAARAQQHYTTHPFTPAISSAHAQAPLLVPVQAQIHESYSTTINGVTCTLTAESEKGGVALQASCPGKRGVTHTVRAHLEAHGEQAVIRAWQRS